MSVMPPDNNESTNLGGSGTGVLETPTDLMNADMSATTRQQMSAQQRVRRLKNKTFLRAYRNGDEMTPEEEERGGRLQLVHIKKNKKQHECYRQTAEEERKLKIAEEERKLKNLCLTVTDVCEGEKAAQQQMSAHKHMRRLKHNMSTTTWQQMSSQQNMRRLKNKIFLWAYCNGTNCNLRILKRTKSSVSTIARQLRRRGN